MPIDCYYAAPARDWKIPKATRAKCGEYLPDPVVSDIEIEEWFSEWAGSTSTEMTVDEKFLKYSTDWEREIAHVSSVEEITSHPSYKAIIDLGWKVVPLLLLDLKRQRRFWFPALYAITGVRPFDPKDAGNSRRMTDSWTKWGHRKGLI